MVQKDYLKLIDKAGGLLQKKKATIAVAESVTSGNLQAAFSLAMNATTFFICSTNIKQLRMKYYDFGHLLLMIFKT